MENRTWPLVRVLGRYPVGWKHTFADQNFYQNPEKLDDKRLLQYMPLTAFTHSGKGPEEERHPAETRMVSPRLDNEFRELAKTLGLKKKATAPAEKLQEKFPGVRHVKVEKQPGGKLARVTPEDGPPRKIQLKKASEAAVIWRQKGKSIDKLQISVRWPAIFREFGVPRHDPPLPTDVVILDVWPGYKSIWLDEENDQDPGFYRVKEFTSSEITVLPENAVTDELAKRLNLKKAKAQAAAPTEDGDSQTGEKGAEPEGLLREVKLHRKDLVRFFKALHPDKSE